MQAYGEENMKAKAKNEGKKPVKGDTISGYAQFMTPMSVERYFKEYVGDKPIPKRVAVRVHLGSNSGTFNMSAGKRGISAPVLFPKEIFIKEHDIGPLMQAGLCVIAFFRREDIKKVHLDKFDKVCEEDMK